MRKKRDQYPTLSIEDISKEKNIPIIENFIISDKQTDNIHINLNFPCILEGVAFVICSQGKGKFMLNFEEHDIERNMIICFFPGCILEFTERSEDFCFEFLVTSYDFISELQIPLVLDLIPKFDQFVYLKVDEKELQIIMDFHEFIVKHYNRVDHLYRVDMGKSLLTALIIEFMNAYQKATKSTPQPISHKEKIYKTFFKLIDKHHKETRSVAFYADKMCITPTYMSKVVKKISGKSAHEWIDGMTLNTIKAYLKSSTLTVLQISEELNFPNPSFFGRYFKKHTGMTPLQYRKSN